MTLIPGDFIVLAILSAAIHWLVARSEIAKPLWSRARGWLAKLLACPACSGFWIGCALTSTGVHAVAPYFLRHDAWWYLIATVLLNGLIAMFITPVAEGVMMWGLGWSAIDADPDQQD